MKRTCNGCAALDVARRDPCELNYAVAVSGLWPHYRYAPREECPKPKTYLALAECRRQNPKTQETTR